MKTWKVILHYSSYSKKRGSIQKRVILVKDLISMDSATVWIMVNHPNAIKISENRFQDDGFIYPNIYEIK